MGLFVHHLEMDILGFDRILLNLVGRSLVGNFEVEDQLMVVDRNIRLLDPLVGLRECHFVVLRETYHLFLPFPLVEDLHIIPYGEHHHIVSAMEDKNCDFPFLHSRLCPYHYDLVDLLVDHLVGLLGRTFHRRVAFCFRIVLLLDFKEDLPSFLEVVLSHNRVGLRRIEVVGHPFVVELHILLEVHDLEVAYHSLGSVHILRLVVGID